ncbi:MAG TPA: efflux RND transporter permease subunit [Gammaproteobacteria bacterium]|nr:efflux RND transporter permease subunit [Gammaproteobacteria bacterium]
MPNSHHSRRLRELKLNPVGRVTRLFIGSKITVLLMLAAALLGVMALLFTPRTYNPQISVPVANVIVRFPGASAKEVENQVIRPLESLMASIQGVDHTYGYASSDMGVVTVRFKVGQNQEQSLVKLYNQIARNMNRIPPGVSQPLVQSISIHDVPILTVSLSSNSLNQTRLRKVALRVMDSLRNVKDVGNTRLYGASPTSINVWLQPQKLANTGIGVATLERRLKAANVSLPASHLVDANGETRVRVDGSLGTPAQVGSLIVATHAGKPVYLRDVARIKEGPSEPRRYSYIGYGAASHRAASPDAATSVTIAIDKRAGSNNVKVADALRSRLDQIRKAALPDNVHLTVTRDYGRKANDAVDTLIEHLGIAVGTVALLLWLFLGWREASIVTLSVPLVLAVVLGVDWVLGQTINRITLFALILSLGLLVDDAIVVIENIHRHMHLPGRRRFDQRIVLAANEVGRPTNIATFAVILALVPMAFVTGMMGPFMGPIPLNAPTAMLVSLGAAYIVVPWVSLRWLRGKAASVIRAARAPTLEERGGERRDWLRHIYLKLMRPLADSRRARYIFGGIVVLLLLLAMLQPLWQFLRPAGPNGPLSSLGVGVKMLPDDNTNTVLLEVKTPEGTAPSDTDAVVREVSQVLSRNRYVTNFEAFHGYAAPPDFAALVRGDSMRRGSNFAQVRVNLMPKGDRSIGSHGITQALYTQLAPVRKAHPHTRIKLYETPPGPPVRSQVLAELYGPDYDRLRKLAGTVEQRFDGIWGMDNRDDSVTADAPRYQLRVDKQKAAMLGLTPAQVASTVHDYMSGYTIGMLHAPRARAPVNITVRLPESGRTRLQQLLALPLHTPAGKIVPLGNVVTVTHDLADKPIYTQDQHRVVYVSGDMLHGSPVDAVITLQKALNGMQLSNGDKLTAGNLGFIDKRPDDVSHYRLFWGGEMRLTLDVFRDLGSAFIVSLLLIYLLLAAYYQSFMMPLVVMGAIPVTLIGVFPGHWLLGEPFTATSMIGVIALAGIVVRNSLLLIDFIIDYRREGNSVYDAVLEAGAVRTRPILLTALAIVLASIVMVGDPVFGGLAISLIFGVLASTVLTLFVIPLMYMAWQRRLGEA